MLSLAANKMQLHVQWDVVFDGVIYYLVFKIYTTIRETTIFNKSER